MSSSAIATRPLLVGLTSYPRNDEGQYSVPGPYVDAVRRAGGMPVIIPAGSGDLEALVDRLDALVLIGGGDIDPARYSGNDSHPTIYNLSAERDDMELRLAELCVAQRLPTLAICRGIQIVNVAFGGTLHEHIPDVLGDGLAHRAPPRDPIDHEHVVDVDSQLGAILGETRFVAKSWHHQSIKTPAPGFRVVATADDGCAEAMEHPEHPQLLCVQWHPELTAGDDPVQQRLFDYLTQTAREGVVSA